MSLLQETRVREQYTGRGGPTLKELALKYEVSVHTIWKAIHPERAAEIQAKHRQRVRKEEDANTEKEEQQLDDTGGE